MFFKILSYGFGYDFSIKFNSLKNHLLSLSISRKIKNVEGLARFQYPIKIQGFDNIVIGKNFESGKNLRLQAIQSYNNFRHNGKIEIGNDVTINPNCQIVAINKIVIGNNVLIASNVFISDHSHGDINFTDIEVAPSLRKLDSKGPIFIEDNVWIGQNVSILPNIIIGQNAIIGANSVITKNVLPYTIVAGNPAKVLRQLEK